MINKSELGIVTSSKIFLDSNNTQINEDGLFSQRIFGPIKSHKCLCGNYNNKSNYENQRCPSCGVLCSSNELRYSTFGKIILPFPAYKQSYIAKKILNSIIKKEKYILSPKQCDRTLREENYLEYNLKKDSIKITKEYLINQKDKITIPLKITGLYTIYLSVNFIEQIFNSKYAKYVLDNIFVSELLVVPPGVRQAFIQEDEGKLNIKQHELNNIYEKILKLTSYDWLNIQGDPNNIINVYIKDLYEKINTEILLEEEILKYYDQSCCRYQSYINDIYKLIEDSLSGKEGHIRSNFLGKSIDFSSRSHIIPDTNLKAYEIKIPKNNFLRLYFIEYIRFLQYEKKINLEELLTYVKVTESKIIYDYPEYIDEFLKYIFSQDNWKKRIMLTNRQPTLFRFGLMAMIISDISNDNCIHVSHMCLEQYNADFDGDTKAIYRPHSDQAIEELIHNAFQLNNVKYDQNENFLSTINDENIYAAYVLLESKYNINLEALVINDFKDMDKLDFRTYFDISIPIKFNKKLYPLGIILFNYWAGFNNKIVITKFINKNKISEYIYDDCNNDNYQYYDRLSNLVKYLFFYVTLIPKNPLTLSLSKMVELDLTAEKYILNKLPNNPIIGYHIYKWCVVNIYKKLPKGHFLEGLLKSGLGKIKTQLIKMIGSIGYIADDKNIILSEPIHGNILGGLTEDQFFNTCIGARKGLVDKEKATPDSGYLSRSLNVNLSPVQIGSNDCKTTVYFPIKIQSIQHARMLIGKYFLDKNTKNLELFTKNNISENIINETYNFRSPITCDEKEFKICKKCFGESNRKTPYVGILTGQYASERITQLTMRSFHTSGACSLVTNDYIIDYFTINPIIDIKYIDDNIFNIIFKENIVDEKFISEVSVLDGYIKYNDNILTFNNVYSIENEDVSKVLKNINNLLKTEKKNILMPVDLYNEYIKNILEVGDIFSVYIEIVLCNMYITSDNEILRYALNKDINNYFNISKKLNPKLLNTAISKLLGLLYEPNRISIAKYSDKYEEYNNTKGNNKNSYNLQKESNTILEKMWRGEL